MSEETQNEMMMTVPPHLRTVVAAAKNQKIKVDSLMEELAAEGALMKAHILRLNQHSVSQEIIAGLVGISRSRVREICDPITKQKQRDRQQKRKREMRIENRMKRRPSQKTVK